MNDVFTRHVTTDSLWLHSTMGAATNAPDLWLKIAASVQSLKHYWCTRDDSSGASSEVVEQLWRELQKGPDLRLVRGQSARSIKLVPFYNG